MAPKCEVPNCKISISSERSSDNLTEPAKSTIEKQVQLTGPGAKIRRAARRVLRINQSAEGVHIGCSVRFDIAGRAALESVEEKQLQDVKLIL